MCKLPKIEPLREIKAVITEIYVRNYDIFAFHKSFVWVLALGIYEDIMTLNVTRPFKV